MKIVVITGSAHKNGTSAYLAEKFIGGAEEAGHEIFRFDAAYKNIHPCIGCDKCKNMGSCAFQDDMNELNPHLLEADAVVLVSPIYYYDVNAQIKAAGTIAALNSGTLDMLKETDYPQQAYELGKSM